MSSRMKSEELSTKSTASLSVNPGSGQIFAACGRRTVDRYSAKHGSAHIKLLKVSEYDVNADSEPIAFRPSHYIIIHLR
jgi:hypothetical protein